MGITNLLSFVGDAQRRGNLHEYANKVVAVDGYVWLHRGLSTCAHELAFGVPTLKYVSYCMKRVKQLLDHNITPIIVFDGAPIILKKETEEARRRRREMFRSQASALKKRGSRKLRDVLLGCLEVTYDMVGYWIRELRKAGIQYVVAPYEADAQLAYLCRKGIASAVITEDSDLLVFGAYEVLYKLDSESNFSRIRLHDMLNLPKFKTWNHDRVGIKTSYAYLQHKDIEALFQEWNSPSKGPVRPEGYEERFRMAELVFKYQRVYNSDTKCLVGINEIPEELLKDSIISMALGPPMRQELVRAIAEGEVNPITLKKYQADVYIPPQVSFKIPSKSGSNQTSLVVFKGSRKLNKVAPI